MAITQQYALKLPDLMRSSDPGLMATAPRTYARALPHKVERWSLTTLREMLIRIGATVVRQGRFVTFQRAVACRHGRSSKLGGRHRRRVHRAGDLVVHDEEAGPCLPGDTAMQQPDPRAAL